MTWIKAPGFPALLGIEEAQARRQSSRRSKLTSLPIKEYTGLPIWRGVIASAWLNGCTKSKNVLKLLR
jgi:hypothetical protein